MPLHYGKPFKMPSNIPAGLCYICKRPVRVGQFVQYHYEAEGRMLCHYNCDMANKPYIKGYYHVQNQIYHHH